MITSFFSPKTGKKGAGQGSGDSGGPSATGAGAAATTAADDGEGECSKRARTVTVTPNTGTKTDKNSGSSSSGSTKRIKTSAPKPTAPVFGGPTASAASMRPLSDEVEELLSYMDGAVDDAPSNDEFSSNGTTWRQALDHHVRKSSFSTLARFVASERKNGKKIYPPPADVFSALNLTPLHKIKVVIVGQDPYHGPNQGHGLAFSVRRGVQVPPSLRNIYKELINDDNIDFPSNFPSHGCLEKWAKQGVLMLNAVLTVRGGEANSHKNRGWESFTDECIRAIDKECRARQTTAGDGARKCGIVFLLWGNPASKKAEGVISKHNGHAIIKTSHPSPLGATKTASPFLGSKCFSRANQALAERGMETIDWNVD